MDDYERYYDVRNKHEIAMRVILSGVCLVAIATSLFLFITILRFKRLKTRTNMYILHLSLLNAIYNVGIFIYLAFDTVYSRSSVLFVYVQFHFILMHVTFAFLLSLDWFLTATKPNWMIHYQKFYQYIFICIYVFFVVGLIVAYAVSSGYQEYNIMIYIATYFFIIMLLILLNVLRGIVNIKTEAFKTRYGFTIANITLFSYIPCMFHHFVYLACIFYDYTRSFESVFYFITFLPYIVWIGHPVLVVYILGYLNEHFKMAYLKSFRRSSGYSREDLDELYEEENIDRSSNVNVVNGQQKNVNT